MNVLHLNTFPAGGSFEYARMLSDALRELGINSTLLTIEGVDRPWLRALATRLVRRIAVAQSKEAWHDGLRFLPAPTVSMLESVDIVHLHVINDWFNVPHWMRHLPSNVRVVISLHDLWHVSGGCFVYQECEGFTSNCRKCPALEAPARWLWAHRELKWKEVQYGQKQVRFIANSEWLKNLAMKSVVTKACGSVDVVHPGIDTEVFRPRNMRECRKSLQLPENAFIISTVCAAVTDPYKNVEPLLKWIARSPTLKRSLVLVVGDGRVAVPDMLNVRFRGKVYDRETMACLLGSSDVLVSASRMETYGLSLVEAMACGTPVVAFRVGGIPEAAPHNEGALLCEPENGAELIDAIERLHENQDLRESLGRRGRQLAMERNSPAAFANAVARIYEKAMQRVM